MTLMEHCGLTRARTHRCPADVLSDPHLSQSLKRSLLADWASDRHAVPSKPWLRRVPGMPEPLPLNDILAALAQLDDDPPPKGGAAANAPARQTPDAQTGEPAPALASVLIATHQRNIARYYRLLATHLSDLEKAYVRRRIIEERREIKKLTSGAQRSAAESKAVQSKRIAPRARDSGRHCSA